MKIVFKIDSNNVSEQVRNLLSLMNYNYSSYYKKWIDCKDDRKLFCNICEMYIEALIVMNNIENNLIWVAFNQKRKIDFERLNEIINAFRYQ